MDTVLRIPLMSELENSICRYYNRTDWLDSARDEDGIKSVSYTMYITLIVFDTEEYKTLFLLRWS